MKLIGHVAGLAAVQVAGDEVIPLKGVVGRDLIEAIARQYELVTKPALQMVMQGQPLIFQGGVLKRADERIGIVQLALVPNGDFVMAQTTEQADAVLSDLINFLEQTFEYRYKDTKQKRLLHSNVVVQFDRDFGSAFELFSKIETLINHGRATDAPRFQFKRIAFGQGDPTPPGNFSIDTIENADFTIERRAGAVYSENKFFCGAPLHTEEHLALLEKLEKLF